MVTPSSDSATAAEAAPADGARPTRHADTSTLFYLGPAGTFSHAVALRIADRIARHRKARFNASRNSRNGSDIGSGKRRTTGDTLEPEEDVSRDPTGPSASRLALRPCASIRDTWRAAVSHAAAVESELASESHHGASEHASSATAATSLALLPYHNSTFGGVRDSYALLASEERGRGVDVQVVAEETLAIRHALLVGERTWGELRTRWDAKRQRRTHTSNDAEEGGDVGRDGTGRGAKDGDEERIHLEMLAGIDAVYSHEQALGQCRGFLDAHLPRARRIATPSTADGAMRACEADATLAMPPPPAPRKATRDSQPPPPRPSSATAQSASATNTGCDADADGADAGVEAVDALPLVAAIAPEICASRADGDDEDGTAAVAVVVVEGLEAMRAKARLRVARRDVQDRSDNATRFLLVQAVRVAPRGVGAAEGWDSKREGNGGTGRDSQGDTATGDHVGKSRGADGARDAATAWPSLVVLPPAITDDEAEERAVGTGTEASRDLRPPAPRADAPGDVDGGTAGSAVALGKEEGEGRIRAWRCLVHLWTREECADEGEWHRDERHGGGLHDDEVRTAKVKAYFDAVAHVLEARLGLRRVAGEVGGAAAVPGHVGARTAADASGNGSLVGGQPVAAEDASGASLRRMGVRSVRVDEPHWTAEAEVEAERRVPAHVPPPHARVNGWSGGGRGVGWDREEAATQRPTKRRRARDDDAEEGESRPRARGRGRGVIWAAALEWEVEWRRGADAAEAGAGEDARAEVAGVERRGHEAERADARATRTARARLQEALRRAVESLEGGEEAASELARRNGTTGVGLLGARLAGVWPAR